MLSLLHIENIAVIERVEIAFGAGLNVLTGETGAGKSIIIDALNLLSGQRAFRDMIRTGEKQAVAEGVFTDIPAEASALLDELGIPAEEDNALHLARQVDVNGRNICRINGRPAPLSSLRAIGEQLLRCHGQHDSRSLANSDKHLGFLDSFAETEAKLAEYQALLENLKAIRRKQRSLQMDEGEKARRMEMLSYQLNEIEAAAVSAGEDELLYDQRRMAEQAEDIRASCQETEFCLSGSPDGEGAGAVALLKTAASAMVALDAAGNQQFAPLAERLTELAYLAEGCAADVAVLSAQPDELSTTLEEINDRLYLLNSLKKKYGGDLASVLAFAEDAKAELEQITYSEEELARLEAAYQTAYQETMAKAKALSETRRKAARELEKAVKSELAYLSMAGAQFSVVMESRRREGKLILGGDGLDLVSFYIAPNKGEEAKPLAKTASGGELSRIMLALQTVLAGKAGPTLIFDEIDTGISGEAGARVAERLAKLSGESQVLCVTHLPQMAAMADVHFHISKGEKDGRTATSVAKLASDGRVYELARITSGDRPKESLLSAARDMLSAAEQYKKQHRSGQNASVQ